MNPTDMQVLKAELAAIQSMSGSIDSLITTAAGQGSAPAAAAGTPCGAFQNLSETTQKASKLLERVIDKA
jgi:hypothetical protein